jgi:hypothetical protein
MPEPVNRTRRQMRLAAGRLQTQGQQNHSLLLNMDEDALLRPFTDISSERYSVYPDVRRAWWIRA